MSLPVHPLAGQRVGYARISSVSQNLDGQTDALRVAGCEKFFADTASGKLAEWPELSLCLGYLRAGDTLVVVAARSAGSFTAASGGHRQRSG